MLPSTGDVKTVNLMARCNTYLPMLISSDPDAAIKELFTQLSSNVKGRIPVDNRISNRV